MCSRVSSAPSGSATRPPSARSPPAPSPSHAPPGSARSSGISASDPTRQRHAKQRTQAPRGKAAETNLPDLRKGPKSPRVSSDMRSIYQPCLGQCEKFSTSKLTWRPAALSCTRCPCRPSGVCSCCFGSSASLAPCAVVWYTSSVPGGALSCRSSFWNFNAFGIHILIVGFSMVNRALGSVCFRVSFRQQSTDVGVVCLLAQSSHLCIISSAWVMTRRGQVMCGSAALVVCLVTTSTATCVLQSKRPRSKLTLPAAALRSSLWCRPANPADSPRSCGALRPCR